MNQIQYYKQLLEDPNWDKNNVKTVSIASIGDINQVTAQVRQSGTSPAHKKELKDSIKWRGQKVPITVHIDPEPSAKGCTQYIADDGLHRLEAILALAEEYPENLDYQFIRVEIKTYSSEVERIQYQIECNDHGLPSKSNTMDDAATLLKRMLDSYTKYAGTKVGSQLSVAANNRKNPALYKDKLLEALRDLYPQMHHKTRAAVVDKFLLKVAGKFQNYDADNAGQKFKYWAVENKEWKLEHPSKKQSGFKGKRIYKTGQPRFITPNVNGNCMKAKTDNPNDKTIVIVWSSTVVGISEDRLDEIRRDQIEKLNQANHTSLLKKPGELIDQVFIAPQKLTGVAKEQGFYEVKKDSSGLFSSKIPSGWAY